MPIVRLHRRAEDISVSRFAVIAMLACASLAAVARVDAQTADDGIMIGKGTIFFGDHYSHDSWDHYWEGSLERTNGNIGTVTTQTNTWFANYGVTDRLNVIANVPYVWTRASQGVLHGMSGFQDVTLIAKYNALETPFTHVGSLRAIGVMAGGVPLTNYTPDLLPLSIGLASKRLSGRVTLHFQSNPGWFATGTTAYTWRGKVTLDRPYYYTDGQLFLTNKVTMPQVLDYTVSGGYLKRGLMATVSFSQQHTEGGGDIRRQDIPFVSNRMNFSKVGAMVMYPLPKLRPLAVEVAYGYTLDGRNVGKATTVTTGLNYRFSLHGSSLQ
jgi:hypothetical protein